MKNILAILSILVLIIFIPSCGPKKTAEKDKPGYHTHADGSVHSNHAHDQANPTKPEQETFEVHTEKGEEDDTQYGLNDTYDVTKNGVQLVLKYNKASNSFEGKMTNTSNKTIDKARVEVHLSNGIELGPTKAVNLARGTSKTVTLKASKKSFETWSAHAETGSSEHSHGSGEHSHGSGEHTHQGSEHGHEHGEH